MENPHSRVTLYIDLDAIARNYRLLQQMVGEKARVAGVVKANAYGLGMVPVVRKLHAAGCRDFYVAMLDEAVALRAQLATIESTDESRIFVLHGVSNEAELALCDQHQLIPVLFDPNQFAWVQSYQQAKKRTLPVVIHIDTGMHRLGLEQSELATLKAQYSWDQFDIRYVMSHLACSDDQLHPMNEQQLKALQQQLTAFGLQDYPVSFANSAGVFLGAEYHLDMVRAGCALYGVNPTPGQANPMQPVVSLEAEILRIHTAESDGSVGYSASAKIAKGSRIATLSLGYADGMLRSLSNQGKVMIAGVPAPMIGRVSMDLITIDISHFPVADVTVGTKVEIVGEHQSVDQLAEYAGTIGYEILTSLGSRYRREYIERVAEFGGRDGLEPTRYNDWEKKGICYDF